MERIQAALKKAREARGQRGIAPDAQLARDRQEGEADTEAFVPPQEMSATSREELWKGIQAFHPNEDEITRNRVVAFNGGPESSPYDVMRTKLLQQLRRNKWTRVAITSPTAGAGKSMTSANLAFSLARQSDVFSMLIELDLRKPTIASVIGMEEGLQFSRVLDGDDEVQKHLRRYGRNLIFATNKNAAHNPAELLQGVNAGRVIDEIEATLKPDVVLFDTPPMFAGDDTIAFIDQVDCVLLIAEAEKSTVEEIDKCERELASRTNVLGVVLNKCRYLSRHEEYGKEYYGQ